MLLSETTVAPVTTFSKCCQGLKGKVKPHEHPEKITEDSLIKIRLAQTME